MTAPAPSWYFPVGEVATTEQIAALAAAFGVEGPVREIPADMGGGFQVGAADSSGDSINVSTDAMQSWWYSRLRGHLHRSTCDMYPAGDPMANTDTPVLPECDPATPPAGVPTAAEAEALAKQLLTRTRARSGQSTSTSPMRTNRARVRDGVSACSTGVRSTVVGGVRDSGPTARSRGRSGYLRRHRIAATTIRGSGVDQAVARLNEQQAMWGRSDRVDRRRCRRHGGIDAGDARHRGADRPFLRR